MTGIFEKTNQGYVIRVRIAPNSSSCSINGMIENASGEKFLKVSVTAVPEKGKANKELINFLAKKMRIAKSNLEIVSGDTDRWKKIRLLLEEEEAETVLIGLAEEIENE